MTPPFPCTPRPRTGDTPAHSSLQPRLLFLASCAPYGLSNVLSEQAATLAPLLGNNLLCIAGDTEQFPGARQELLEQGVPLQTIPGLDRHASLTRLARALANAINSFTPTIVQVHSNWQLLVAHRARRLSHRPFRLSYWLHGYRHNHPVKSCFARAAITAALAACADLVIVTSGPVRKKFRLLGGKLRLLHQGVERPFFNPELPGPDLSAPTRRLIFAGQFRPGKNQEWLLHALSQYRAITADHSVRLLLPGTGERLDSCRLLARTLGIADAVDFPGHLNRDAVLNAYLSSQIAVIPANAETFGYCIAEPLVLGRLILSRPVGCAADLLWHGMNGYLFNTPQELTRLLLKLLPNLPACASIAHRARLTGAQLHWQRINQQYLQLLRSAGVPPAGFSGVSPLLNQSVNSS